VEDQVGAAAVEIRDSLIEGSLENGLAIYGDSQVVVDRTVVRGAVASGPQGGAGVLAQVACSGPPTGSSCPASRRPSLTVTGSVLEANERMGAFVAGAEAVFDGSVVRDTQPEPSSQSFGRGLVFQMPCADPPDNTLCEVATPTNAVVVDSVIERSREVGLFAGAVNLLVESTSIVDTLPMASDQTIGMGISIDGACAADETMPCDPAGRSQATLRGSFVGRSHYVAAVVIGSDATLEGTVLADTVPQASDQKRGTGLHVEGACAGLSDGVTCDASRYATASVVDSLITDSQGFGMVFVDATADVSSSVVQRTTPEVDTGYFGDGLASASERLATSVTLTGSRIDDSARAGVGAFGAALSMQASRIGCADLALAGTAHLGFDYALEDLGDNLCGCPTPDDACKIVGADLQPPGALEAP
jgi:hypothetical protein